jgi:manganese/zinc/iron transport system substrate-binding protein
MVKPGERWNALAAAPRCGGSRAAALALSWSLGALAWGCGSENDPAPRTRFFSGQVPIRALATTAMVADLVKRVGAPHVEVQAILGEGTDPHSYRPSPGDVKRMAASTTDVIFYNGLHLEGKMAEGLERLSRQKPVHAVAEGLPESRLRSPPEFQGFHDPHVWFDVSLWSLCLARVRDVLADFDPPRAEDYRRRAAATLIEWQSLHAWVAAEIATIPPERRILITAHDAFGYFGQAYGIEVHGIQGISTESEAGVRRIKELVDLIVARGVKAVFVESSVSEQNVQSLVDGCGARGHVVSIGGQLYSDAMGKDGTPEGEYPGMMRHNVRTIVEALR